MHSYNTRHSSYAAALTSNPAPATPAVATTAPVVATAAAPPSLPAPVVAPPSTHDGNDPVAAPPSPSTLNDVITHAVDGIGAHTQEVPAKFPSEVVHS
jgi:hypothetical protein